MKKRWIYSVKILLFLGIVLILGNKMLSVLNYKDMGGGGGWQRYYQIKGDITDVYFFGNSHAHCTIDQGYLWDNYGIAGYTLSAGSQGIDSTYFFIEEVLSNRKPKVLVVEVYGATGGDINNSDADVYRNSLGMHYSGKLWKFTNYFTKNMNRDSEWRNQVLSKLPVVHSRYMELTKEDFEDPMPFMRGYRGSFETIECERPVAENNKEILKIHPDRMKWLEQIVELAAEKNVPLIFIAAPYCINSEEQMNFNAIEEYAKNNNVPFINFNHLYDEIGLNFKEDFRDVSHVNNSGAVKVTSYLAEYLKSQYKLPDRREEEGYELWIQNSLYLENKKLQHEFVLAADINEYLQLVSELGKYKTVILALTGNYGALGDVYFERLLQLGISREDYESGGIWIFKDGKIVLRLEGQNYSQCLPVQDGEIHLESSLNEQEEGNEVVKLLINSVDYRLVDNGVNIVIYDEAINQVIDAAGDDVYLGTEMIHKEFSDS